MTGRTVVFGGTFDPVHNAHLAVARTALLRFNPKRILFVPAAKPPHKGGGAHAGFEDRAHMLDLACADEPRFEVSRIERPGSAGGRPSYSILTIEALLAMDEGPLDFLIGADAFAEIRSWHRWQDVVRLVEFIVVTRPGASYDAPAGAVVHELAGLELPESSSAIRAQLERGAETVAVPAAVLAWIRNRGLYGTSVTNLENNFKS
jgi:nicotinate-nucleotide adenylyltransferase